MQKIKANISQIINDIILLIFLPPIIIVGLILFFIYSERSRLYVRLELLYKWREFTHALRWR